jgi:Zinc carboxypeptidase
VSAYRTFAQLSQAIDSLASAAPSLCETFTLPEPSVEGAAITGLHFHAGDAGGSRNGVLLLGGVHARELMNPEAIVDLAADLLISYVAGSDISYVVFGSGAPGATWAASAIRVMLESLDIWMVPCSNPDGHDYVLSTDDMWRKNRRPEKGSTCSDGTQPVGVDLNRNCAIVWGVIPTNGEVSCDPCDYNLYCGPAAFSEPESQNIEQLLSEHPIDTFADVHTYGEMILYPWGHAPDQTTDPAENFTTLQTGTCNPLPDSSYSEYIDPVDLLKFQSVGSQIASDVAKVRGRTYSPGPSIGLYPTTGTNPEYAYSRHIVEQSAHKTYGWTIETGPTADNAADSFHPSDPSQIILDAKAAMLSLVMQSVCAIELIGTEPFGADAEAAEDQLVGLRAWRDALWQTDAGRAWLELYRQLHLTLLALIAGDEGFRSRFGELVDIAVVLADDPDSVLSDDHIRSGLAVIDDLAATSPEHLRIQLQTPRALFQTMSGYSAEAALALLVARSPG